MSILENRPEPDQEAAEAAIFLVETSAPEQISDPIDVKEMVLLGRVSLMGAKNSFEAMQKYSDALRVYDGAVVLADPSDGSTFIFGRESDYDEGQTTIIDSL